MFGRNFLRDYRLLEGAVELVLKVAGPWEEPTNEPGSMTLMLDMGTPHPPEPFLRKARRLLRLWLLDRFSYD